MPRREPTAIDLLRRAYLFAREGWKLDDQWMRATERLAQASIGPHCMARVKRNPRQYQDPFYYPEGFCSVKPKIDGKWCRMHAPKRGHVASGEE